MNCANHPDRERAAFCQNCGKPLCTECTRPIGSSVFCEPCLAARVAGAPAPGYAYTPAPGFAAGPAAAAYGPGGRVPGEPNPSLAGFLGLIPGVGAMYNEQYAKGIVHLAVFAVLVSLAADANGIFGIFVAGWIVYMAFEANQTARARRDGTPLPNPFGLNDLSERMGFGKAWPATAHAAAPYTSSANTTPASGYSNPAAGPVPDPTAPDANAPPASPYTPPYSYTYVPPASSYVPPTSSYVPPASGWGTPRDEYSYNPTPIPPYVDPSVPDVPYYRRFPAGAVWLIGLGVVFLLGNAGIFHFSALYFGPFLLIGIGVWIFVHKMTSTGQGLENDGTQNYQWRVAQALRGSFWLFITGIVWMLDVFHILSWGRSWPLFLIAGGIALFLRHSMYGGGASGYNPGTYVPYPGVPHAPPVTPPVTSTDLVPTVHESGEVQPADPQEGR